MGELIAVFKSRSQTMDCAARLKRAGISCTVVNTPKEAGVGCGLSVKFLRAALPRVQSVIKAGRYSAFFGVFSVGNGYGGNFLRRL